MNMGNTFCSAGILHRLRCKRKNWQFPLHKDILLFRMLHFLSGSDNCLLLKNTSTTSTCQKNFQKHWKIYVDICGMWGWRWGGGTYPKWSEWLGTQLQSEQRRLKREGETETEVFRPTPLFVQYVDKSAARHSPTPHMTPQKLSRFDILTGVGCPRETAWLAGRAQWRTKTKKKVSTTYWLCSVGCGE